MKLVSVFILCFCSSIFAQNLSSTIKYLALGDSYTIGASVADSARWPNQLMDSLNKLGFSVEKKEIIATSGWTTTNLLSAMNGANLEKEYTLISILIGVNNFFQSKSIDLFKNELAVIIDSALVLANQDTNALFMVTIPDYGYTPYGSSQTSSISKNTDLYNGIKDSIANVYGIPLYNITDISRRGLDDPSLVASDGLHPSGKQYGLWVDLLLEKMGLTTSLKKHIVPIGLEYSSFSGQIVFKARRNGNLVLYKISGEKIMDSRLFSGDISRFNLNSGAYLVKFVNDFGIETHIIIQP
jgi:lysophospholipase L1-like esterase